MGARRRPRAGRLRARLRVPAPLAGPDRARGQPARVRARRSPAARRSWPRSRSPPGGGGARSRWSASVGFAGAQFFATWQPGSSDDPFWLIARHQRRRDRRRCSAGACTSARGASCIWTLRNRAERAEAEQELRVAQARANERARIAREMHDVLAHRISQVSMHAGALAFREDLTPDEVRDSAAVIREQGARGADRPARRARRAPRRRRRAGARTAADVRRPGPAGRRGPRERARPRRSTTGSATPAEVPDAAGRTLYRIVQEGITNARKHAPGSAAHHRAHRLARRRPRRGDAQPARVRQRDAGLRARPGRADRAGRAARRPARRTPRGRQRSCCTAGSRGQHDHAVAASSTTTRWSARRSR